MRENRGHLYDNADKTPEAAVRGIVLEQYVVE